MTGDPLPPRDRMQEFFRERKNYREPYRFGRRRGQHGSAGSLRSSSVEGVDDYCLVILDDMIEA